MSVPESSPSLESITTEAQRAANFWLSLDRGEISSAEPYNNGDIGQEAYEVPRVLTTSGAVITAGLRAENPADVHAALDSLIAIERAQRLIFQRTEQDEQLTAVGNYVEASASDLLEDILERPDPLAVIKTLRFLCHRTMAGSDTAQDILSQHIYKVIQPPAQQDAAKKAAKQLQIDMLDTMSHNRDNSIWLRQSFLWGIGYKNTQKLAAAWAEVGKGEKQHQQWRRQNLATMLALEQREPGLSKAITDTFRIRNFARFTPNMLHAMYRARLDNPEQPYAEKLVASSDHNFANSTAKRDWLIFRALQKLGIGYEIHEFGSKKDINHAVTQAEARAAAGGEITDLLIDSHGNRKGLFGSQDFQLTANIAQKVLQPLKAFLRPTARIIVGGCSAAKLPHDGTSIAEHIQRIFDREVVASKIDGVSALRVRRNGRIDALFGPPSKNRNVPRALLMMFVPAGIGTIATKGGIELRQIVAELYTDTPDYVGAIPYVSLAATAIGTGWAVYETYKRPMRRATAVLPCSAGHESRTDKYSN